MWAEDQKGWLREPSPEKNRVRIRWRLLVRLIQRTFKDRVVPEEVAWETIVFLPKGSGGYQGIGLVEVLWNVYAVVFNYLPKRIMNLHDTLRGFRSGRVTGTATLKTKSVQQLSGIAHKLMFQVFLDVQKTQSSLNRGWGMGIIMGYGMGQNRARLISHH